MTDNEVLIEISDALTQIRELLQRQAAADPIQLEGVLDSPVAREVQVWRHELESDRAVRSAAIGWSLQRHHRAFVENSSLDAVLTDAERIAAFIRDGDVGAVVPDWAKEKLDRVREAAEAVEKARTVLGTASTNVEAPRTTTASEAYDFTKTSEDLVKQSEEPF